MSGVNTMSTITRPIVMKWLNAPFNGSNDLFEDPGYSQMYRSGFGNTYQYGAEYVSGDIDEILNLGCFESPYEEYDEYDADHFVDYIHQPIPQNVLTKRVSHYEPEHRDRAAQIMQRKAILIPPGSNQSNANYIFKTLTYEVEHINSFRVPYATREKRYTGARKLFKLKLDKYDVYRFLCHASTNHHDVCIDTWNPGYNDFGSDYEYSDNEIVDDDDEFESDDAHATASTHAFTITRPKPGSREGYAVRRENQREYQAIHVAITELRDELCRFIEVSEYLWDNVFVPFIESNDCVTLNYIPDRNLFVKFMKGNKLYTFMYQSLLRLSERSQLL